MTQNRVKQALKQGRWKILTWEYDKINQMVFDFVIKLYSKKETSATLKCTKVINVETAQVKISTYQAWDVWKLLMLKY